MGYKLFNDGQPFEPARCAAACEAETKWNVEHLNSRMLCKFFTTYVLMNNGEPQGQYCSIEDHYTIASSYSYSNTTDPGKPKLPCDVPAAKSAIAASSLQPSCSTLLGYTIPVSTVIVTEFTTVPATTIVNTVSPVATTTATVIQAFRKRDIASLVTPAALTTFAASAVSAACSLQATPVTETSTTSTTTIATVNSGTVATTTTLPVRTTIVTSTVVAAPTCTASGANIIQNGGFENDMSAWPQRILGANDPPTAWEMVTAGNDGTGFILTQQLNGLTKGVTYTFSYKHLHTDSPAAQIACIMSDAGLTSKSMTNDERRINSWHSGPDFGTTFVARVTTGLLECHLLSSST
ncbi:hypothetical protein G6011_06008 [Alternaria panax]|uniref:Uncharacterized protein n=1 Tax=Alternaria panax TaxID=48097 RepID=A0AAD4FGU6_9PLEO|nr:hypothetical protein G6011_06008 [Alternaria panax]